MKLKRIISAALSVTLCLTMLAGCKSTTPPASGSQSKPASTGSTPAGSGEPMTITVLGIDWGYGPTENSEMEQAWEKLFNVNLEIQWVNFEDYPQKANALISTNTQPDVVQIMRTGSSYYYPIFTQAVDAGNFIDMTKYLFDGGIVEKNATMKNWDQSMWDQSTYNGGIYILPRSKGEIAQQSGVNVRRDLMRDLGFEKEPTNMEELKTWLIDLSNAATKANGGEKIYALEFFGDDFMHDRIKAFATAFTGQMDWGIDANGEFQFMQFNENYIDFLNWMKDLYTAGVLDKEFALGNGDTSKWKAGKSVAYLNAWYNWNQSADLKSNKVFDKALPDTLEAWCLMPIEGPKGKAVSANPYDIDQCIAISSSCSEEKIAKIMEVFNATEEDYPGYNLLMSDGVADVHYTLKEDGTLDTSDEVMGQKRTEGYVGAWNQIFLKIDADQITGKFKRAGTKATSQEAVEHVEAIKADIISYLETSGLKHENLNLQSATYANNWATLTADVNSNCALYVMDMLTEQQWKDFVKGIVDSAEYKAIQAEYKAAAAK